MSRGERKAMITRDAAELSLSRQCRLLSIGRSSFYYAPRGESPSSLARMRRIDELFMKYPGIVRGNVLELSGVLVLASVDEKPIPIFQDVTRGYPPGGDDVYPLPPVAAASRGPAS